MERPTARLPTATEPLRGGSASGRWSYRASVWLIVALCLSAWTTLYVVVALIVR